MGGGAWLDVESVAHEQALLVVARSVAVVVR
jgi:hypothetical protein